jgi:2-polyprenyl-3-methyl-5-hydroxy-6-metoxy-1,4-benzoquinol methylase
VRCDDIGILTVTFILATAAWFPPLIQAASANQHADVQVYEAFRAWITKQPPGDLSAALEQYRRVLAEQGLDRAEVDRRIQVIVQQGQQLEIERWNRILTAPSPAFNTKPNAFLVQMTEGRSPGTALDVGMGQGRNAIYLARQGWTVTGFDPADRAVAAAKAEAARLELPLTALAIGDEGFDFGLERWDLIVLSYVGVRHLTARLHEALRPGGLVVVEAFHRDATKDGSIGGAVVFDTNELLKMFESYRILHYEDVPAVGDFGMRRTRIVRLAAEKR